MIRSRHVQFAVNLERLLVVHTGPTNAGLFAERTAPRRQPDCRARKPGVAGVVAGIRMNKPGDPRAIQRPPPVKARRRECAVIGGEHFVNAALCLRINDFIRDQIRPARDIAHAPPDRTDRVPDNFVGTHCLVFAGHQVLKKFHAMYDAGRRIQNMIVNV